MFEYAHAHEPFCCDNSALPQGLCFQTGSRRGELNKLEGHKRWPARMIYSLPKRPRMAEHNICREGHLSYAAASRRAWLTVFRKRQPIRESNRVHVASLLQDGKPESAWSCWMAAEPDL